MPIYVYECPKCHRTVELNQGLKNRIAPLCCEKDCNIEMDRVISKSNFSLKGNCWAKDGYSNKG